MALAFLSMPVVNATADVVTKGEVNCVNTMNKSGRGVTKNMAGVIQGCYKSWAKGKLLVGTAESCAGTPGAPGDPKGKVQKAIDKTGANFIKKCAELPDVGPQNPAQVNDPSIQKEFDMYDRIVGSDLDLLPTDKIPFNCVSAMMKGAAKCQDAKIKEFLGCKKTLFKTALGVGGSTSAADIRDGCLDGGGPGYQQPDLKGKIAKKCTDPLKAGIFKDMGKKCLDQAVVIGDVFQHGECAGACATGGTECSTCIERIIECELCEWVNAVDGLDRNCDEFDDGNGTNGTCGGAPPTTTTTPSSSTTTTTACDCCGFSQLAFETGIGAGTCGTTANAARAATPISRTMPATLATAMPTVTSAVALLVLCAPGTPAFRALWTRTARAPAARSAARAPSTAAASTSAVARTACRCRSRFPTRVYPSRISPAVTAAPAR
jgi:hypothetical protein